MDSTPAAILRPGNPHGAAVATSRLIFIIPNTLRADVAQYAARHDITLAEAIRRLLTSALAAAPVAPPSPANSDKA